MKLAFTAPTASDLDRERGLAAAYLFLKRSGISIEEVKQGIDARASWVDSGMSPMLEPDPILLTAAEAWDNAMEAAFMTCYGDRSTQWGAALRIVPDNDQGSDPQG
ncbi:hypothetical protein [Pseudorhodoferax soli]|uniref:Uncharacterized protein n=1 Tax=Pseudorhodoferax soli TaxID=545864 RepID=A0A368XGE0_9BURK|nr:hypothetical protein [Pseudorhodoferax soli]RCW66088.1 hypothetical protein DES41_11146 [Pseudorhodoferax soli]